jgi:hypothetical protein
MFIPTCHVVATTICVLVLARQVARRRRESLKRQGIMATVLIAAAFCLSIMPYGVYRFGESFFDKDDKSKKIFHTTYLKIADAFLLINTISNFYIYSLTVQSFRNFLWSIINTPCQFATGMGASRNTGKIVLLCG